MTEQPRSWTHWLIPLAKIAVIALLCWFIYRAFIEGNETLGAHTWHVEPIWLVVSGVLYLVGLLPSAIFWQRILVRTGQEVSVGDGVRAYYISQLGKYVPGKAWVILVRVAILPGHAPSRGAVALAATYETLTTMASGALMIGLTSHGGVTALVIGGLYQKAFRERGLAPENLSRSLEDSVTIVEPVLPWTVSAMFMAATLGVPTLCYLPWASFCWTGPIFSLAWAAAFKRTGMGLKRLSEPREDRT